MLKISAFIFGLAASVNSVAGTVQVLNPEVSFQAVHRLGPDIWASGTQGGIYHSADNGLNWRKVNGPADSQSLQFRDIQPLGKGAVMLMSAGEGQSSRLYRSDDSGQSWRMQLQGTEAATFFDCIHFSDPQHGWLYGDSDQRGLYIQTTSDGGLHWQRQQLPFDAQPNEGGFASSGTCVNQGDNFSIYIGTGNGAESRLLSSSKQTWQSLNSPIEGGEASGIFSVQQAGDWLYVFGGSLKTADKPAKAYRYNLTSMQWSALPSVPLNGAIYGSALLVDKSSALDQPLVLIANPQGVAMWRQGQPDWQQISHNNIWSLACDAQYGCVGVGKDGVVESFQFE